jgi:hypothetical protein
MQVGDLFDVLRGNSQLPTSDASPTPKALEVGSWELEVVS